MKTIVTAFLILFSLNGIAQNCSREIAQSVPTILEKGFDKKAYSANDAYGKKLGDAFYAVFAAAVQQSKGLHGNFNIIAGNDHLPGLLAYHTYACMFYVYCTKEGKLDWKGLWNLSFECTSNNITGDWGDQLINELIGIGANHFVYLDNNIIYKLEPRQTGSELSGYPFIEAPRSGSSNTVLITRPGTAFFNPVTRRQYLALMKRAAEAAIVVEKKSLAESIKNKVGMEDAIDLYIKYSLNDIKEIDAFLAGHSAEYLEKPCITNHEIESLMGTSLSKDKEYFFDAPGAGKEWVVINPGYINKKLSPTVPQFFLVSWGQGQKEVEKKAALLFRQSFDFKKLATILQ